MVRLKPHSVWHLVGIVALLPCVLTLSGCGPEQIPHAAIANYLHAEDFYVRGQIEAAAAIFTSVSQKYPTFYQAGFMEAKSLYLLQKSKQAAQVLERLVRRFPQYHEAQIWLAQIEVERGDITAADKRLTTLLGWDSRDPRLLYLMALVRTDQKKLQEAITYLREAEAFGDQLAQVHLELGRLYYRFGLVGKADNELTRARQLLPAGSPLEAPIQQLQKQMPAMEQKNQ